MKHLHHIIPRYEGGSDFAENLVELTVTQHAMWHFAEWQRKGDWRDEKAWRGLAGLTTHEETVKQVLSEAGKVGGKIRGEQITKSGMTESNKIALRKANLGRRASAEEKKQRSSAAKKMWEGNEERRQALSERMRKELKGRRFWNNGVECKMCRECPGSGWVLGRGPKSIWKNKSKNTGM